MRLTAVMLAAIVIAVAVVLSGFAGGPLKPGPYVIPEATLTWQADWITGLSASSSAAQSFSPRSNASIDTTAASSSLADPPYTFVLDKVTVSVSHQENGATVLDSSWTGGPASLKSNTLAGPSVFAIHAPAMKVAGHGLYTVQAWFSMHRESPDGTVAKQSVNSPQQFGITVP